MEDNRKKALAAALGQIEKQFGKGSVMRLGDANSAYDVEAISTGSLGLDIALGIGGLPKGRYFGVQFDKANKGFWYSRYLPEGTRVRYHKLGDDPANDAVVFGEKLQANEWPWAQVSDNGRWLMLGVTRGSSGDDVELYLKNVEKNGPIVTVADTLKSALSFTMVDDRLVITTNWKTQLISPDRSSTP